jgi:opacity protein-like surface antigen
MDARLFARWVGLGSLVLVVGLLGMASPVAAQERTESVRIDETTDNVYQIVGRTRAVGIPNFMLGAFYDQHSANWRDGQTNFGYGLEFVYRKVDAFEVSAAVEYADLSMPEDMWLEAGKRADKADRIQFDMGLASLVFSGYYYWDVTQWFSPYVGGGLGAAMVLGDVTKFSPRRESNCRDSIGPGGGPGGGFGSEQCYNDDGSFDDSQFEDGEVEDRIPAVVPMVNVTTGTRFNIGKHGVVKLEFGFYNYLFAGLSAGAQW